MESDHLRPIYRYQLVGAWCACVGEISRGPADELLLAWLRSTFIVYFKSEISKNMKKKSWILPRQPVPSAAAEIDEGSGRVKFNPRWECWAGAREQSTPWNSYEFWSLMICHQSWGGTHRINSWGRVHFWVKSGRWWSNWSIRRGAWIIVSTVPRELGWARVGRVGGGRSYITYIRWGGRLGKSQGRVW
jgi:hypothetical protein